MRFAIGNATTPIASDAPCWIISFWPVIYKEFDAHDKGILALKRVTCRKLFQEATNMDHPFKVGSRYRNRTGDYVVTAINGESMTARYDDGHEQTLNVAKQTHIWQSRPRL